MDQLLEPLLTLLGPWTLFALTVLNYALVGGLIMFIVSQRRESPTTWAWIFFLLLVPLLGLFAFWVLGANRMRLRRWRRRVRAADDAAPGPELTCPEEIQPGDCPFPADVGLLHLARRLDGTAARAGNAVTVYREGKKLFDALEAAIEAASRHVHLVYYIWAFDSTGARLRDALTRAVRRGVEVRLLIDDAGSLGTPDRFFAELTAAGGQVHRFFPVGRVGRRLSLNHRNHRKIVVADGTTGFAGGMNVGDDYAGPAWYDAHVRVVGPAVHRLQEIFCHDWFQASEEDLAQADYFPPVEQAGQEWVQFVASGPADDRWHAIHTILFAAINQARERVWLETPYFVPDGAMALALETAALRGVDVRLALPGRSDHRVVLYAGRSYYSRLLAAGVKIYEVPKGFLHAKTATIDRAVATVGSANLDQRSFRLNFEANAFFYGPSVAAVLEESFLGVLEHAEQVEASTLARRGRLQRLLEAMARLLGPVL